MNRHDIWDAVKGPLKVSAIGGITMMAVLGTVATYSLEKLMADNGISLDMLIEMDRRRKEKMK